MRAELPLVDGDFTLNNRHQSAQVSNNWLPVAMPQAGTRTRHELLTPPGLRPFALTGSGAIRGGCVVEGKLYVVSGAALYRVNTDGPVTYLGAIPGTGRVSMAHNQRATGNELAIDNGVARYVLNTVSNAFAKVTDEAFPGSVLAFYIDQYLGFVEPAGRYWGHSDLADAHAYNSFDRYEAEADPDRIVSAFVSHREVLIFGKKTVEPFVNNPTDEAGIGPFQRASNTVIECGCAARFSVAGMDNTVFFLDDKRVVRRLVNAYTPERISDLAIEQWLADASPEAISRAYAFVWEDRGHKVYYLTVPGHGTRGFDLLSGKWHRRSSPGRATWRLSGLWFWDGRWIGGDAHDGKLYVLDWDYHYDGTEELVRERVSGVLSADQSRIFVHELELLFGVGGPVSEKVGFGSSGEWLPVEESGLAYTFDAVSATLTDSVVSHAGEVRDWSIELPAGTQVRVTAQAYNAGQFGDDDAIFSTESGTQGNEAADPETEWAPSPFTLATGADGLLSFSEATSASEYAFLIEVWIPGVVEEITTPADRVVLIAISKDGGHNFGDWKEASLGAIGEYRKRIRYRRLGSGVQFVLKVRVTSPIRADLMGLIADMERG